VNDFTNQFNQYRIGLNPLGRMKRMEQQQKFQVLLYYQFVPIEDPIQFAKDHLTFCQSLGLKGRILVAVEGINGTVSGTIAACQLYKEALHQDIRFKNMVFKSEWVDSEPFRKLFVRPRKGIIRLYDEDEVNPNDVTGKYLKPSEFYAALQQEDVIVVDGRNDYEYEIGHFRNAIRPDVQSFREFPQWIRDNREGFKDKKIITYCTGGIRCEKLTGLFINEGFEDVNQLEGGIITYGQDPEVKGRLWDGKCYVFDNRISIRINRTNEDVIVSHCRHCQKPSDRYINCYNDDCHLQHICCEACEQVSKGFCSEGCHTYALNNPERDHHNKIIS
jgi:UPF0176 protein